MGGDTRNSFFNKSDNCESDKLTVGGSVFLYILRIIAAIAVLVGHSFSYYNLSILKDESEFCYIQNIGVVLFFLLSGFFTVYSINQKQNSTFITFFQHKLKRIMREYIPGIIFIAALDKVSILVSEENYLFKQNYTISSFIINLCMLQGMSIRKLFYWVSFEPFGSGRPLWTLSIEWWFYLIYSFLYFKFINNKKYKICDCLILIVILVIPIEYIIGGRGNGLGIVFCLGILCYYIYKRIQYGTAKVFFYLSIFLYFLYGIYFKDAYSILSYCILWIMTCSGIRYFSDKKINISMKKLVFLSNSTFFLYLIHYSIIDFIYNLKLSNTMFSFGLGIFISIALSWIFYYAFSKIYKYLQLRKKEK